MKLIRIASLVLVVVATILSFSCVNGNNRVREIDNSLMYKYGGPLDERTYAIPNEKNMSKEELANWGKELSRKFGVIRSQLESEKKELGRTIPRLNQYVLYLLIITTALLLLDLGCSLTKKDNKRMNADQ